MTPGHTHLIVDVSVLGWVMEGVQPIRGVGEPRSQLGVLHLYLTKHISCTCCLQSWAGASLKENWEFKYFQANNYSTP